MAKNKMRKEETKGVKIDSTIYPDIGKPSDDTTIPSDTFCAVPWAEIACTPSGNMRMCCNSDGRRGPDGKSMNTIIKPDGSPYKLHIDNIEEAWNSDRYKTIRQEMLDGIRPEMCKRVCFAKEDAGLESMRQKFIKGRAGFKKEWFSSNTDKIELPLSDIKYIDIRLGNLCNLKCRMCSPNSSNLWVDEWPLLNGWDPNNEADKKKIDMLKDRLGNITWPEEPEFWDNIEPLLPNIELLYVLGGEPTLITQQYKLYDMCIEKDVAKNIILIYNSNVTNVPKKMIEYWSYFKRVRLGASIDGYDEVNKYIRFPANWKSIEKNMLTLLKQDIDLEIHCTVQMYNILYLKELIDWANKIGTSIYMRPLQDPNYLCTQVLPKELKVLAREKLKGYEDYRGLKGILSFMDKKDLTDLYPTFLEKTKIIDESRKQNLFDIVPEFKLTYQSILKDQVYEFTKEGYDIEYTKTEI